MTQLNPQVLRKLILAVLVLGVSIFTLPEPVLACERQVCPDFYHWQSCACGCVCTTEECCNYYGWCSYC